MVTTIQTKHLFVFSLELRHLAPLKPNTSHLISLTQNGGIP